MAWVRSAARAALTSSRSPACRGPGPRRVVVVGLGSRSSEGSTLHVRNGRRAGYRESADYPRAAIACLAASTRCSAARFIFFNSAEVRSWCV